MAVTKNRGLGGMALPRKLTAELAASAILASVIESYLLLEFGLLAATDLRVFMLVATVLGVADIVLILALEEFMIRTRFWAKAFRRTRL